MTEYSCSVCKYTSEIKENVTRHINKKKTCGFGSKEIIEIPIEIKCEFCNKNFSSPISLNYHIKKTCKYKDDVLKERIKELEKELKEAKKITIGTNINNVNIIIVNNYENTLLDKLTDNVYNKIIKDAEEAYKIIPSLIKQIHFNSSIPENHNIYLSNKNKNNKHLQIFRNGHWEIENKNTEIDNLISDKETNLSDWVTEKGEKYPKAKEKYNEYLEQKYEDEEINKMVKEEVELVLYNGRHLIKS
jgi:ElaB/YqjD/DUF883 family membrane-anchored ribosome-binding protein